MKRLILAGGGHAHLFVLEHLARFPRSDLDVTLISPDQWQYYSGMLPGWMAGVYRQEQCRIDLRPLAAAAGARFIRQPLVGMKADQGFVCTTNGRHFQYDLLSIDVGSETNCEWLGQLGDRLLPVKSRDFQSRWLEIVAHSQTKADFRLIVVGGGAAGVELALAARQSLRCERTSARVTLVCGPKGLLREHGSGARLRIAALLDKLGVEVLNQRAVGVEDGVLLADGRQFQADSVVAATGARAPIWLRLSGLRLDNHGYVDVDQFHRSRSHAAVFAAGDVCARSDVMLGRSGVHAVRAGPVLAHNLLAALDGRPLRPFRPSRRALYLLASGNGEAVASWGSRSASGRWVWRWKDLIDRRFVRRFTTAMPDRRNVGAPEKEPLGAYGKLGPVDRDE